MKKRVVAFLMCAVMILAGLPVSPLADYVNYALVASAASGEISWVELSYSSLSLYETKKGSLTATAFDTNGNMISGDVKYEWASSDESAVSVSYESGSSSCEIIGVKGDTTATVTVTASYGGSASSAACVVTVKALISSITMNRYVIASPDETQVQISYYIRPTTAGRKELKWSVEPEGVCSVDDSGVATIHKKGACTVTAEAMDGSGVKASTVLIVTDGTSVITLDKATCALKTGETADLTATGTVGGYTYTDRVIWTSSNTSVATVNMDGVVLAVGRGEATITAKSLDGSESTASCKVTVTQPVKSVSVQSSAVCSLGGTYTLVPTVSPSNANNLAVTWKSSDDSIATVDTNGVVSGKNLGTATITVTTVDGGYTDTCDVSVEILPSKLTLSETLVALHVNEKGVGETATLTAALEPDNATNKNLIWTSSDETVATVGSSTGVVKAVAGGEATITCRTQSGGVAATCKVKVTQDENDVQITNIPTVFYVDKTHALGVSVTPLTATDKSVTWTSSDSKIVTVSSSGVIKGINPGTAVITATSRNLGKVGTAIITVSPKVSVTGITLNMRTATISRDGSDTLQLVATVSPDNASDKAVVWSSSDTNIATVTSSGVVVPKKSGAVNITATAIDGSGRSATCTVTVTEPVTGIILDKTMFTMSSGEAAVIKATVQPSNASNKTVYWSSSDPTVADVNENGLVTAGAKAGRTIITAITDDGSFYEYCVVTVTIPVTGVKINATTLLVPKGGESKALTATVLPSKATNKNVTWTTTDSTVATVTSTGVVTGKMTGTAVIAATSVDGGYRAEVTVKVIQPVTKLSLTYSSITLDAGKTKTLEASVRPITATDKTVKWKSSNTKVAKVSSSGVVTAVAAGTATITCESADGYATTTCKITVTQPTTGIKLSASKYTVRLGTPRTLKATVTPETANNKSVVWRSSDESVATVSSDGVVKGVKVGKAKITATTANGLHSATATVTVIKPVTSVSLNKTSLTIVVGKTSVITPTIKPKSATNKDVTWKSSDNDVVKVSSSGKITAKSAGYAVVTCTTEDGGKTAECSVLVVQPVKSVKLNKTKATLDMEDTLKLKVTVKPSSASNKAVKWSSSNKKVAKVTSSGTVKPVKPGKATITVTSVDGGLKATCVVTVVRTLEGISVQSEKTVFLGEEANLRVEFTPSNATNKNLKWTSSKKSVATVSSSGVIIPKKTGKTTVTVVSEDGGHTEKCKVTVKRGITSLKINKTKLTLNAGKTYTLKITKKPSNATEDIIWTTSKRSVAVVNQEGVITAMGRGTATITGITEQGIKVKCKVTVKQPVTSMNISKKTASVYLGETLTLSANVLPTNANNQDFTWSTSDKSVATVSGGKVTPKKLGTVKIVAKSTNGKTATCTVTVLQHVSSVALNKTSINLDKGKSFTLVPKVSPSTASEKGCTFTSSNPNVATVSAAGVITAKAEGTAVITVKTKENNKTVTCTVKVTDRVTGVKLDLTQKEIARGDSFTLTATVSPSTATNKAVTWSSSNSSVATVENGVVTGKNSGTAVITVTTVDGSFKASCTVTVRQYVTGVTLKESVTVNRGSQYTLTAVIAPSNAYDKTVTWTSSDEDVVSVTDGVITAESIGEATITVTTNDGGYTDTCLVRVNEPVTGVSLDITEIAQLYRNETAVLTATVYPETDTQYMNRELIWTTSDSSVAAVENGTVTAKGNGEATITVTTVDGSFKAQCTVKCFVHTEEITTDKEVYYIICGESGRITATALPTDASDKSITWSVVDGGEYFTLDSGLITAGNTAGQGHVKITSVESPEVTKTVEVNIVPRATSVTLNTAAQTINRGDTYTLVADVGPAEAYDKSIVWMSDDETVATVDQNGVVTALKAGKATITATTHDENVYAECEITVTVLSESIKLNYTSYSLYPDAEVQLSATVLPSDTVNKNVTWSSDNKSVATVDENGKVTAVSAGTATITVTAEDTGITATVMITVLKHVEGISFADSNLIVNVGDSTLLEVIFTPADAANKNVTWTSSDTRIATVDSQGNLTALSEGTVFILAESEDGGFTAMCVVKITAAE